ncbi:MAG: DUF2946 family protein [Cypionkella sp.]|nr:hypothetical protein [Cypionkella sp.]
MKCRISHSLICLMLCLCMTVAGVSRGMAGVAMARVAGSIEMVICSEIGAETILIDAQGEPLPLPSHICKFCPECVLGHALTGSAAAMAIPPQSWPRPAEFPHLTLLIQPRPIRAHLARGPPNET